MEKLNLLQFISIHRQNHRFRLESSFQEILYMIDVWINNGSGWNVHQSSLNTLTFQLTDP